MAEKTSCSECFSPAIARGLCRRHYQAWYRAEKAQGPCARCGAPGPYSRPSEALCGRCCLATRGLACTWGDGACNRPARRRRAGPPLCDVHREKTRPGRAKRCLECRLKRGHAGRGLCSTCYSRWWRQERRRSA